MNNLFYQLLAERIDPSLIVSPTVNQKLDATSSLQSKEQMSVLGASRTKERNWKNGQRKLLNGQRKQISKSSLFLDRKPDLLKPQTVLNTAKPQSSLLGNRK